MSVHFNFVVCLLRCYTYKKPHKVNLKAKIRLKFCETLSRSTQLQLILKCILE